MITGFILRNISRNLYANSSTAYNFNEKIFWNYMTRKRKNIVVSLYIILYWYRLFLLSYFFFFCKQRYVQATATERRCSELLLNIWNTKCDKRTKNKIVRKNYEFITVKYLPTFLFSISSTSSNNILVCVYIAITAIY